MSAVAEQVEIVEEKATQGEEAQENGTEEKSEVVLPKEIRLGEDERKRYPSAWLIAVRPLVEVEPNISGDGRIVLKAAYSELAKSSSQSGGSRGPMPRNTIFPHGHGMDANMDLPKWQSGGRSGSGMRSRPHSSVHAVQNSGPGSSPGGMGGDGLVRGAKYVPPVEENAEIKRGDKAWRPSSEIDKQDEDDKKIKALRSILNKLTLEKFDKLYQQVLEIEVSNAEVLQDFVKEIFEKALYEPNFVEMYAKLCLTFHDDTKAQFEGKQISFKKALLKYCKEEFTATADGKGNLNEEQKPEDTEELSEEDQLIKEFRAKRRMLGNIKFIGELYKVKMIPEKIIITGCLEKLLKQAKAKKEEDVIECLCKLMTTVGATLTESFKSNPQGQKMMDDFFREFHAMAVDGSLPKRMRFMLDDLIDLRKANWEGRKLGPKAKKISEIHKEAKEEEEKKNKQGPPIGGRGSQGGGGGRKGFQANPNSNFQSFSKMTQHLTSHGRSNQHSNKRDLTNKYSSTAKGSNPGQNSFPVVSLKPGGGGHSWFKTPGPAGGGGSGGGATTGQDVRKTDQLNSSNMFQHLASDPPGDDPGRVSVQTRSDKAAATKSGDSQGEAKAAPKAMAALDEEALDLKTRSLVETYLAGKDRKLTMEYFKEFPQPNHSEFLFGAVQFILGGKFAYRESLPALILMLTEGPDALMSVADFVQGAGKCIAELDEIEMDDANGGLWLAKFFSPVFANGHVDLKEVPTLFEGLEDVSSMRQMTFTVHFIHEYSIAVGKTIKEAKMMYDATKIDLLSTAKKYNEQRGEEKLRKLLEDKQLTELVWS